MAKSYIPAVGRRKRAIARVRLFKQKGDIIVNGQPISQYFPGSVNQKLYLEPFRVCNCQDKYHATIKVEGSGISGQLGAVIHGLARALAKLNPEKFKPTLRHRGFLTRDPRKKERRKVGTGGKARRQKQSPKR